MLKGGGEKKNNKNPTPQEKLEEKQGTKKQMNCMNVIRNIL